MWEKARVPCMQVNEGIERGGATCTCVCVRGAVCRCVGRSANVGKRQRRKGSGKEVRGVRVCGGEWCKRTPCAVRVCVCSACVCVCEVTVRRVVCACVRWEGSVASNARVVCAVCVCAA